MTTGRAIHDDRGPEKIIVGGKARGALFERVYEIIVSPDNVQAGEFVSFRPII